MSLCLNLSFLDYTLAPSPCCYFEINSTETTCPVTINDLPSIMMGDESVLVLELQLVPARCNFVSNMSQLLVHVKRNGSGE